MHVWMCIYTYIHMYLCVCIYIYVYIYIYIWTCVLIHVCECIYIYTYGMYVHTYHMRLSRDLHTSVSFQLASSGKNHWHSCCMRGQFVGPELFKQKDHWQPLGPLHPCSPLGKKNISINRKIVHCAKRMYLL